jgi:hypothetical protein
LAVKVTVNAELAKALIVLRAVVLRVLQGVSMRRIAGLLRSWRNAKLLAERDGISLTIVLFGTVPKSLMQPHGLVFVHEIDLWEIEEID